MATNEWIASHRSKKSEALSVDMIARYNISLWHLPQYELFTFTAPTTGVKAFILSSLENENSSSVNIKTRAESFYNCYESANLHNAGGWANLSGSMVPAVCHNECSTNVSVLNTPIALPDYALHTDYTRAWFNTSCADQKLPFPHSDDVSRMKRFCPGPCRPGP